LVTALDGKSADVWLVSTEPGGASRPLLADPFVERDARFSPDGRLVAYVSHETTPSEIAIQTLDDRPKREVVSVGGGTQPVWTRDGRELLFVDPQGVLRKVGVRRGPDGRPIPGRPEHVGAPLIGEGHYGTQYDVSPNGRLYLLDRQRGEAPREIGIVLGWQNLLR